MHRDDPYGAGGHPVLIEGHDEAVLIEGEGGEVEQILSTCRQAGCEIDDMEVAKADLEDVFVQIMRREGGLPAVPQTPAIPDSALEPAA